MRIVRMIRIIKMIKILQIVRMNLSISLCWSVGNEVTVSDAEFSVLVLVSSLIHVPCLGVMQS